MWMENREKRWKSERIDKVCSENSLLYNADEFSFLAVSLWKSFMNLINSEFKVQWNLINCCAKSLKLTSSTLKRFFLYHFPKQPTKI